MAQKLMGLKLETRRFSNFLRKYRGRQLPQNAEEACRKLAFLVLRKAIMKAPVDEGRHRAGWSMAAEAAGMRPPPAPPDMTQDEKGRVEITRQGLKITMTLTNGVEYSIALEHGHSAQAPFGMVRISMREVEAEMGGRQLPNQFRRIYAETWDKLGMGRGAEIRAGQIAEALDLTHGASGLT